LPCYKGQRAEDGSLGPETLLSAMTFSVTLNFFTILTTKTEAVVAFPEIKENRYSSFVNLTDDINIHTHTHKYSQTLNLLPHCVHIFQKIMYVYKLKITFVHTPREYP
jgi:hypothetical protein